MSRSSDRIWEHDSLCEVRDQSGLPTTEIDSGCLTFSSPEGREFRPREATGESLIDVQKLARMLGFEPLTRSEEHTSELQSLMRISYAVFCLKKKKTKKSQNH